MCTSVESTAVLVSGTGTHHAAAEARQHLAEARFVLGLRRVPSCNSREAAGDCGQGIKIKCLANSAFLLTFKFLQDSVHQIASTAAIEVRDEGPLGCRMQRCKGIRRLALSSCQTCLFVHLTVSLSLSLSLSVCLSRSLCLSSLSFSVSLSLLPRSRRTQGTSSAGA